MKVLWQGGVTANARTVRPGSARQCPALAVGVRGVLLVIFARSLQVLGSNQFHCTDDDTELVEVGSVVRVDYRSQISAAVVLASLLAPSFLARTLTKDGSSRRRWWTLLVLGLCVLRSQSRGHLRDLLWLRRPRPAYRRAWSGTPRLATPDRRYGRDTVIRVYAAVRRLPRWQRQQRRHAGQVPEKWHARASTVPIHHRHVHRGHSVRDSGVASGAALLDSGLSRCLSEKQPVVLTMLLRTNVHTR